MSNVISLAEHQQAVWIAYVTAAKRAQESGRMEDHAEAKDRYADWLAVFVRPEHKAASMMLARSIEL